MLQRIRAHRGEIVIAEYVLMLSLGAMTIALMSGFVRRALQGNMHTAQRAVGHAAVTALGNTMLVGYEPYYEESSAQTAAATQEEKQVDAKGNYVITTHTGRSAQSVSTQLPPKD